MKDTARSQSFVDRMFRNFINKELRKGPAIGDHPIGLSVLNKEKNLCFVLIPKNASTSISMSTLTSKHSEWFPFNFSSQAVNFDTRYIVVLRDPVDRFISTTNMFLAGQRQLFDSWPIIKNNILITQDQHYQSQVSFIKTISHDNIDFFMFNKNVVDDIQQYYNLTFENSISKLNVSKKVITQVNEELIKTLYADDYQLINSVKFVNMP